MILTALLMAGAPLPPKEVYSYAFPGHDSCGDWTQNRSAPGRRTQALEGWILGLVTGYNFYAHPRGNVAPGVSATALLAWVDRYCVEHPLDPIMAAGTALVEELKSRK